MSPVEFFVPSPVTQFQVFAHEVQDAGCTRVSPETFGSDVPQTEAATHWPSLWPERRSVLSQGVRLGGLFTVQGPVHDVCWYIVHKIK